MRIAPYDTTICQYYKPSKIRSDLQAAQISQPFPPIVTPADYTLRETGVVTPRAEYDGVHGFTQPLDIGTPDKPLWVLDGRPYMKITSRDGSYRLVSDSDYRFQCVRLALTQIAAAKGASAFRRLGDFPIRVFSRWISMSLTQRFNLDVETQMRVAIIAAYYYYAQLSDALALSEEDVQLRANQVGAITMSNPSRAMTIGEQLEDLSTIEGLCKAIGTHTGTVRLEHLKASDLLTLIANSWVGINARENIGVALEHIPTWVALVYAAVDDRGYRKTLLTSRVESTGRKADQQDYAKAVIRLVATRYA